MGTQQEKQVHGKKTKWTLKGALTESWLGLAALISFMIVAATSWETQVGQITASVLILIAAVMSMNGWARTDMLLKTGGEHWWQRHRLLRPLHFITNEGELAGIMVGTVAVIMMLVMGRSHDLGHAINHSYHLALTLYGIMSAANLAVKHIQPIMAFLENTFGTRLAVILGSLLSSLTGEPAAAVFLADFIKDRVAEKDKPRVATGLAATIGSGGGLMPYAAPPVLIVWGMLHDKLGWEIRDLILYVGAGCVMHVIISSFWFLKLIQKRNGDKAEHNLTIESALPLAWLTGLIIWHVEAPGTMLWIFDVLTGIAATWAAHREHKGKAEVDHEERFTALWQPLILSVLLLAIELIGMVADPLVFALAEQIPATWSPLAIGLLLFFATAWISHVADNALASRVFMSVPIAMIPTLGIPVASFLAACVVMGALFGGFLMIPANLPNFYIARVFRVDSKSWVAVAIYLYPTGVAYVAWIFIRYWMI